MSDGDSSDVFSSGGIFGGRLDCSSRKIKMAAVNSKKSTTNQMFRKDGTKDSFLLRFFKHRDIPKASTVFMALFPS